MNCLLLIRFHSQLEACSNHINANTILFICGQDVFCNATSSSLTTKTSSDVSAEHKKFLHVPCHQLLTAQEYDSIAGRGYAYQNYGPPTCVFESLVLISLKNDKMQQTYQTTESVHS